MDSDTSLDIEAVPASPDAEFQNNRQRHRTGDVTRFTSALNKEHSTIVYIDGQNVSEACLAIKMRIDYIALWDFFAQYTDLIDIKFYHSVAAPNVQDKVRGLLDLLRNNNYTVITREYTEYHDGNSYKRKSNMDPEMMVHMVSDAFDIPHLRHVVVMSGDGDFTAAINKVKEKGIRVSVISPDKGYNFTSQKLIDNSNIYVSLESFLGTCKLSR